MHRSNLSQTLFLTGLFSVLVLTAPVASADWEKNDTYNETGSKSAGDFASVQVLWRLSTDCSTTENCYISIGQHQSVSFGVGEIFDCIDQTDCQDHEGYCNIPGELDLISCESDGRSKTYCRYLYGWTYPNVGADVRSVGYLAHPAC